MKVHQISNLVILNIRKNPDSAHKNNIKQTNLINTMDNISFGGKSDLKKMLHLPKTSKASKDINKLFDVLTDKIYEFKNSTAPVTIPVKNKTHLAEAKKSLGNVLIIDKDIKLNVKDEDVIVPFKEVFNFLDIISKNTKKPLKSLASEIYNNPDLTLAMDRIKLLSIANASISDSIVEICIGRPFKRKAKINSLFSLFANSNNSVNKSMAPLKRNIAGELKNHTHSKNYHILERRIQEVAMEIKRAKTPGDLMDAVGQSSKIIETFKGVRLVNVLGKIPKISE